MKRRIMDEFIKNIIEETFASKKQQRYFYAKASDKSLSKKERNKWSKWAKEYSSKTDFEEIPDTAETEVDEIVDKKGNVATSKVPETKGSKGSSRTTTDVAVKSAHGSMGTHGVHGTHTSLRYWAEADMSKALGYKDTLGQDEDMKDAEKYFQKELGMDDKDTEERLSSYGYDDNLSGDKVRLIENPKKYIQDYVESILSKRSSGEDLVKKDQTEDIEKNLSPIVKRQLKSLKHTMEKNDISIDDIMKLLKKDNE
jgi:hypothetical protein